jgi:hypothetical protein
VYKVMKNRDTEPIILAVDLDRRTGPAEQFPLRIRINHGWFHRQKCCIRDRALAPTLGEYECTFSVPNQALEFASIGTTVDLRFGCESAALWCRVSPCI